MSGTRPLTGAESSVALTLAPQPTESEDTFRRQARRRTAQDEHTDANICDLASHPPPTHTLLEL